MLALNMSLRVLEIFLVISYWIVVVPAMVLVMRHVKWDLLRQANYFEAFKNFFLMTLGLSTLFWILFIVVIFLYIRLKAGIQSRESEADEEEGQQQVVQEEEHQRVQQVTHQGARQPVECVVQIVGNATTPHRPAPCLPRKPKKDAAELEPPPRYEELDMIYDTPAI